MKSVNLITESEFFTPEHFQVMDFYDKETVAFVYTEQEFVDKSIYFALYDLNLAPLPLNADRNNDTKYGAYRHYYCPNDFYIITDKGTIGFDSSTFVSKCRVEETDGEFIISVMMETDEAITDKVLEAFSRHDYSIGYFLHETFFSKLNKNSAVIPELVKRIEETPFLGVDGGEAAKSIPVTLASDGEYRLLSQPTDYHMMNDGDKLVKGAYVYTVPMRNVIEIGKVTGFAHSMYGEFYAVIKMAYLYPRDSKEIKEAFPDFYNEHCFFHSESVLRKFIGSPENLSYIPENGKIGDKVIYQELRTDNSLYGVSNDMFQFAMGETGGFGDYHNPNGAFIRVERGAELGTLIEVDGRFKIMFYICAGVVKYKGKHYVRFAYDDESEFFSDFSSTGKREFKKYQHRGACRNVEYLLCRGKIAPVQVSREQFEGFSGDRRDK